MQSKEEYIERFKCLNRAKRKKDLTDAEALEYFDMLIALVEEVYQPYIKKENHEQ